MFLLDPRLANDAVVVGSFALCEVLLMNDSTYPWVILVPRRDEVSEIFQLSDADQKLLMQESVYVARQMKVHFQADKMNVAALGNVVPQLHVHHIARYKDDAAWPKPVWGARPTERYKPEELSYVVGILQELLSERLLG